ncbi:hypothetical protein [Roseibium sp.]|uniref:hypothetical protein n=1 Tax=Roseibium sp. TaxID=1936156 RepID=UPI003BAB5422
MQNPEWITILKNTKCGSVAVSAGQTVQASGADALLLKTLGKARDAEAEEIREAIELAADEAAEAAAMFDGQADETDQLNDDNEN